MECGLENLELVNVLKAMEKLHFLSCAVGLFGVLLAVDALVADRKVYIVYMGSLPEGQYFAQSHHLSILGQVLDSRYSYSLVYSYQRSFNGFAAKLTHQEKQKIARMEGVVSVFESKAHQLHTTRSWDFMGFPVTARRNPTVESDLIVGMIDTGVWPESESFKDDGFGPPPKRWKGICQSAGNFTCNNKLIGARFYPNDPKENGSARDDLGHGTHTASTAAGREVKGANLFGLAEGNARGAVPSARIAVYKVCWADGCLDHSILAGYDDAIADGVDILSVSLGPAVPSPYDEDPIAIGAFHAMRKGVLTLQSAGNNGPFPSTLSSHAPWILTVAASSIDRRIINKVLLGNGKAFASNAISTFKSGGRMQPLIYGGDAAGGCDEGGARSCFPGCLDEKIVKGKIVICDLPSDGREPLVAGASGVIMKADQTEYADIYPLPSGFVSGDVLNGDVISYINSTKEPKATIARSGAIHDSAAPVVVVFSSRGPNKISRDILKPDISAPGVDILAAFSPVALISQVPEDSRSAKYSILSGTSMACPHATGAAGYVKSFHPNWSPAAIKSALMTTASLMNGNMNIFAYGAGHINPVKATDPGLVYDAEEGDYIKLLCSEGYNTTKIGLITGLNTTCPTTSTATKDLNYPSMTMWVEQTGPITANFPRMVTNVGSAKSTYRARFNPQPQLNVTVSPSMLKFEALGEKQKFVVTVTGMVTNDGPSVLTTSIVWSDGVHNVRSPIVVYSSNAM
ncbi:subtilisin-like protease SBT4.3 [Magnolia sinica]|uniref:subtilisin-like protease SBT4.3 n=1 Tax=Magnolia sinica TaxID=86752 RepID=UPI002659CCC9|nr:subtilisin-like protease SBT4.3 [Magnolia sinica]